MLRIEAKQEIWQAAFFESLARKTERSVEKTEAVASGIWQNASELNEDHYCKAVNSVNFDVSLFQNALRTHHTDKVIEVAKAFFQLNFSELENQSDISIAYTGSDGREEKLSPYSSPIEILVVVKTNHELESPLLKKIAHVISQNPTLFHSKIEVKSLEKAAQETNSLMMYDGIKDTRPFPTRGLDAHYLAGDLLNFEAYKITYFNELQNPQNAKQLAFFKKSAVIASCKVFKMTFEKKDRSHVDLEEGKVHYNGDRIKGVKYPYLRTIQYRLGMHVFTLIKDKEINKDQFMQMPFSTIERIEWLAKMNLLQDLASPEDVSKIQQAYITALIMFGISQKNFEISGQEETHFPASDLGEVAKTIESFCNRFFH